MILAHVEGRALDGRSQPVIIGFQGGGLSLGSMKLAGRFSGSVNFEKLLRKSSGANDGFAWRVTLTGK